MVSTKGTREEIMKYPRFLAIMTLFALLLVATSLAAATLTPPLVDVDWVKQNACDQNVVVLDTRNNKIDKQSKSDYLKGHMPCSVHTDYIKGGWRVKVKDIAGMLPTVDKLEKLIGSLGIDNDAYVVVAGAGRQAKDFATAARVYWTFKVLGHEKVSILDGGIAAYAKVKGNIMEKGDRANQPKIFRADLQTEMLITAVGIAKAMEEGVLLVDFRPSDMFLGINKSGKVKRPGTLPGAVNLPRPWLTVNNEGTLRSLKALRELFNAAKVPTEGKQIAFCNTGHDAAIGWFVLSEILGNEQVKMYDGSLAEWAFEPTRPLEMKIALSS